MNPTKPQSEAGRISVEHDGDKPFLLMTGGADRMLRTGRQIIDACQLTISAEVWLQEMRDLLADVRVWIEKSGADLLLGCQAVPQGGRVMVYFFPKVGTFDADLAIELAELNAVLVRKYNVGFVEFAQIPEAEKSRFITPSLAWTVYGAA
jgi:hypothetical protein